MSEIVLAPPGAGLPRMELLIARHVLMPWVRWRLSWQDADALFVREGRRVLAVLDSLPPSAAAEPTLIRRIAGIEDSSRYWSAAMVVEHLNIVNASITNVIAQLRLGRTDVPTPVIAAVKPTGSITPAEVRTRFIQTIETPNLSGPPTPRRGGATCDHPWFGPLNAFGWHTLLAIHQGLHRKQIERVAALRITDRRHRPGLALSAVSDGV